MDHYQDFDTLIIEQILLNLTVQYDCSKFLDSENVGVKFAVLQYYARWQTETKRIMLAIKQGKRLNFLLSLLQYFPTESFEILKYHSLNGSKAERQSALHTLEKINYSENNNIINPVLSLLKQISTKDRIWHIRRDARLLIVKLSLLENP